MTTKKYLNEDVAINDPQLAQQYANGQTQLVNLDKQVNSLQKQINSLEGKKTEINKALIKIEQQAAQQQPQQQPQQNNANSQTVQVTGQPVNIASESLLTYVNKDFINEKKQESEEKSDMLVYLQNKIGKTKKYTQNTIKELTNPMSTKNFYTNESYVDIENDKIQKKEEYLDKDYVFYVKIKEDDNEFIGKIFKISPDGEWYGIVKQGISKTFNKLIYESIWDELDIIEFLENNYDFIEIIDIHEFNEYIENEDVDESGMTGMTI